MHNVGIINKSETLGTLILKMSMLYYFQTHSKDEGDKNMRFYIDYNILQYKTTVRSNVVINRSTIVLTFKVQRSHVFIYIIAFIGNNHILAILWSLLFGLQI